MLGDSIGHAAGQVVGTRVLPPVENEVNLEITFRGSGELLKVPFSDMGTSRLVFRQDGMIEADDGHIVMFGPKGEIARLKSAGLGKLSGPVPQGRYTSTGMFETTAACWKHLNEIIGIFEFVVDANGGYTVKIWEWK
ncbi:MAG: hypothetical protein QM703_23435 [Gemmatales bacterium]